MLISIPVLVGVFDNVKNQYRSIDFFAWFTPSTTDIIFILTSTRRTKEERAPTLDVGYLPPGFGLAVLAYLLASTRRPLAQRAPTSCGGLPLAG